MIYFYPGNMTIQTLTKYGYAHGIYYVYCILYLFKIIKTNVLKSTNLIYIYM